MTGFIRGLFGSNSNNEEEVPQSKDAFFLPADDAKTFGNIEYMRSVKKTRRTFPKQAVGENNEFVQEVSAMEQKNGAVKPVVQSSFQAAPSGNSQSTEASSNGAAPARRADASMDIFRNMARDLKKG